MTDPEDAKAELHEGRMRAQTIRWYVVLTKSAAEWQAQKEILNKGFRCYYPYFYADVRRGRWSQGAVKPQFPGYLFVAIEEGESIEQVRQVHGVREVFKNGGRLVALSDDQMRRCKAACLHRQLGSAPRRLKSENLELGDWFVIPEGFAGEGLPAEVLSIDKSGRVSASLGNLKVSFAADDLKGVRASRHAAPNPVSTDIHAPLKRSA